MTTTRSEPTFTAPVAVVRIMLGLMVFGGFVLGCVVGQAWL
jgi:hypothetical protein